MHTASSAWRCGDVQRSVERWTRERAAVSCSRSSEAYNVKLASICRITVTPERDDKVSNGRITCQCEFPHLIPFNCRESDSPASKKTHNCLNVLLFIERIAQRT